jgi:hypothetical protein
VGEVWWVGRGNESCEGEAEACDSGSTCTHARCGLSVLKTDVVCPGFGVGWGAHTCCSGP